MHSSSTSCRTRCGFSNRSTILVVPLLLGFSKNNALSSNTQMQWVTLLRNDRDILDLKKPPLRHLTLLSDRLSRFDDSTEVRMNFEFATIIFLKAELNTVRLKKREPMRLKRFELSLCRRRCCEDELTMEKLNDVPLMRLKLLR